MFQRASIAEYSARRLLFVLLSPLSFLFHDFVQRVELDDECRYKKRTPRPVDAARGVY
jgi:hypothetical protein